MIKVENISVCGFEAAIRGMRNPMNSWDKSDSHRCEGQLSEKCNDCGKLDADGVCESDREFYCIGKNDMELMQRLFKAGTEHRKYLRMIHVTMDSTAPLYWWKEFDTYEVGTVTNSCSTMHTIMNRPFETSDFSFEHIPEEAQNEILDVLNDIRSTYGAFDQLKAEGALLKGYTKKDIWYCLIQLLPTSYNQHRTVDINYETVFTIIQQRSYHKLDEWRTFVEILKNLPCVSQIGGFDEQSTTSGGKEE